MTTDDTKMGDENQAKTKPKPAEKAPVENAAQEPQEHENLFDISKFGILNDVPIVMTIEVGRTQIKIRDLLNLTKDSILDLNKQAGDPVDIYANGNLIAKGNIITANGKYCVRLISLYSKPE